MGKVENRGTEESWGEIGNTLTDLGVNAGTVYLQDKINEHRLKKRIEDYMERQSGINETCTVAEEIDFQGLSDYLSGQFIDEASNWLFEVGDKRSAARETMLSKAYEYSKADTYKQKERVCGIVDGALEIFSDFKKSQMSSEDSLFIAEICEKIIHNSKEENKKQINEIVNAVKEIFQQMMEDKFPVEPQPKIEYNALFGELHDFVMKNYIKERCRRGEFSESSIAKYSEMFTLCMEISKNNNKIQIDKNIFEFIRENILVPEEKNLIKITGPDGTGKSTFLSILYIYLYEYCMQHGFSFYPFYINLHYYDNYDKLIQGPSFEEKQVRDIMTSDLQALSDIANIYPNLPCIIIIDGDEDYFRTTVKAPKIFKGFIETISRHKRIVCIGEKTKVYTYRERQHYPQGYSKMLYTFKFGPIGKSKPEYKEKFIDTFLDINLSDDKDSAASIKSYIKKFNLEEVDLNTLNIFMGCYDQDMIGGVNSLSDLYKNYCIAYLDGQEELESGAQMSFEYFMTEKRFTQQEISANSRKWNLIHQHKTISAFLIAYYYVEKLKKSANLEDISELEYLFSSEINKFIKLLINSGSDVQKQIFENCKRVYDKGGILAKSQVLYIMGRIKSQNLSQSILEQLNVYYKDLYDTLVHKKEIETGQEERETHLLFRSVIISLICLGDTDKQEKYLKMLLNYPTANQINRAFHLEYYGDIPRKPDSRMYNYIDDGSGEMSITYTLLLSRVEDYLNAETKKESPDFQINLFTLCSLIQRRLGTESLSDERRDKIKDIIRRVLKEEGSNISVDFKAYLTMLKEDIEKNTFARPCLYEKLYGIKDIIRKGWEQEIKNDAVRQPYENVVEHIYYTWMLGVLYLPEKLPKEDGYEDYDKNKILNMILIHDWAEIDVGDIIPKEDTKDRRKSEDFRMRVLLMHDTYAGMGKMRQYKELWNMYEGSKGINARIAYELDKIQALYQFYTYVGMGAEFTEEKTENWKKEKERITSSLGKRILKTVVLDKFENDTNISENRQ